MLYTLRRVFGEKKMYDNLEFDGWNYLTDVHESGLYLLGVGEIVK